jgi:hypothetical protein
MQHCGSPPFLFEKCVSDLSMRKNNVSLSDPKSAHPGRRIVDKKQDMDGRQDVDEKSYFWMQVLSII